MKVFQKNQVLCCSKSLVVCSCTDLAVPPPITIHLFVLWLFDIGQKLSRQEVNTCFGQVQVDIVEDAIFK